MILRPFSLILAGLLCFSMLACGDCGGDDQNGNGNGNGNGNENGEHPCPECPAGRDAVKSVSLSGPGIPWRKPPDRLGLEPIVEVGLLDWSAPPHLGHDAVEVIAEHDGQLYVAARLETGPHQLDPELSYVGVRPVREGRVGRIATIEPLIPSGLRVGAATQSVEKSAKGDERRDPREALADPLTLLRLSHSCGHEPDPSVQTVKSTSWSLLSVDTSFIPSPHGLEGRVELRVEAPSQPSELALIMRAQSVEELTTSPAHSAFTLTNDRLHISFDPAPAAGATVEVAFTFFLDEFSVAGIHPAEGAMGFDGDSGEPRLFFFTGRAPLIPSPVSLRIDMPISLALDPPEGWRGASNLRRIAEAEWTGWTPARGPPTLVSGAYEVESAADSSGVEVFAMALRDEDGNIADLRDYVASYVTTMDFFGQWGAVTQPEVSVAAVSSQHGGSAVYGLVLVPDYIYHRERSRARDFFLAHELSHQWWGAVVWPASMLDYWLLEGMADYSGLRALEILRDVDEAEIVWQENLEMLMHLMVEGYGNQPGRDVPVRPETTAELQDYVYYLKGSWVLRRLEALIGREAMDRVVSVYYAGAVHASTGTSDFEAAVHAEIGLEIDWFWTQWLSGTGLPEIVYAAYFDPDDEDDFELVVTQVGDEPHPETSWRLVLNLESGGESGHFCMESREQVFGPSDIRGTLPVEACEP